MLASPIGSIVPIHTPECRETMWSEGADIHSIEKNVVS